ncbi:hypothetical protein [Mycobacterium sp. SM3041]|uniref:hypothetical protein n=1 Tax=Mycobacterium sp. SM3041 TaxID=3114291 RepID=UPI003204D6FC
MTSPDSERPKSSPDQQARLRALIDLETAAVEAAHVDSLRAQMDEEAEAAAAVPFDEDNGQPLPPHVKVSRPNRTAADYEAMSREIEAGEHIAVGAVETWRHHTPTASGQLNDWKETAARLGGIGRTLVFELWKSGELGSVTIRSRRFSTDAQIDAYIAELEA